MHFSYVVLTEHINNVILFTEDKGSLKRKRYFICSPLEWSEEPKILIKERVELRDI